MRSDYFFVRPSFLRGAARVVDFWGALGAYDTKLSGNAADVAALESDWGMVGRDLNSGIERYRESQEEGQMSLFDGEGR